MSRTTPVRLQSRRKYNNQPQVVDGLRFASKKEAARYQELKLLVAAREIWALNAKKSALRWPLKVNGELICTYEADFAYCVGKTGEKIVIEDVKGFKTPAYRIKKKLMKAIYGIEIREM